MLLEFTAKSVKGAQVEQIEALQKKLSDAKGLNTAVGRSLEKTLRTHFRFLGGRLNKRGGRMKILKKEVRGDTLYLTVEESQ